MSEPEEKPKLKYKYVKHKDKIDLLGRAVLYLLIKHYQHDKHCRSLIQEMRKLFLVGTRFRKEKPKRGTSRKG